MKPVVALAALPLLALAAFAAAPAHAGGLNIDLDIIFGHRHCAPAPVVVERRVYVDRPVVVEREVVVERPVCPPCCDRVVVAEPPVCVERPAVVPHNDCRPERRVEYHERRRYVYADRHDDRRFDHWHGR